MYQVSLVKYLRSTKNLLNMMSQEKRCSKCGGEMREGELFISITSDPSSNPLTYHGGFPSVYEQNPVITVGASSAAIGEGPFWRENTGKKTGLLVKRDETQTLKISGLRCINCGYIELYANKQA